MKMKPYEWQKRFLRIYKKNGVIKAFAGTGKTYATILLLNKRRFKKIIIAVPTRKLKNQWTEELKKHNVKNAIVETFHILSKDKSKGQKCDILVVDESLSYNFPIPQIFKSYNISCKRIYFARDLFDELKFYKPKAIILEDYISSFGLPGYRLCKKIKEIEGNEDIFIYIIVPERNFRIVNSKQFGVDGYIHRNSNRKPCNLSEFDAISKKISERTKDS